MKSASTSTEGKPLEVKKQLQLHELSVSEYLNNKYRTIEENALLGTGRRIENASEGITLQIEKEAELAG